MSRQYKKSKLRVICIASLVLALFLGILSLSIYQYCSGAVGYDKLEQREYTFGKYEIMRGKYGGGIEIYVKEEEQPLIGCPNFARKAVNEDILDHAKAGDKLVVWVSNNSSLFYSYNVHDGKINGKYFLRLEDYQKYHAKNDIFGVVLCSVLLVVGLVGVCFYLIVIAKKQ